MDKLKLFLSNFLVYGLGGMIGMIIPVLLLPFVTRLMPDSSYYGLNDLFTSVNSFAGAVAMMGMYDAMYRYFFEREDLQYRKDLCKTTLLYTFFTGLLAAALLLCFREQLALRVFRDRGYAYLSDMAALTVLLSCLNCILAAPTRMENRRKIFLLTNTLTPLLSYLVAIPLLKLGFYAAALPFAAIMNLTVLCLFFGWLNRRWFQAARFQRRYLLPLLRIGLPLMPNFLVYWIFNSCDRLMLAELLGVSATGVYSVGSKLGLLSQLIYQAFSGGWLYFSYSTMRDRDQVKTTSRIFEYMAMISFASAAFLAALSHFVYELFFTEQYVAGFIVAPYLFLSPLLQMLFQISVNQFLIRKKSWPGMLMLALGALFNVGMNLLLIPRLGIEGAALGTLLGYALALLLSVAVLELRRELQLSGRFALGLLAMLLYALLWRVFFTRILLLSCLLALLLSLFYIFLYRRELCILFSQLLPRQKGGRRAGEGRSA